MRALCGAIISAGALIGLGLLSIGLGHRYSGYPLYENDQRQSSHRVYCDRWLRNGCISEHFKARVLKAVTQVTPTRRAELV